MDTASTFAAITRVLLMCGPMFEQPRPTDVFITTYGINENGKLTRFFHDETTGEISSSLISSLTEYDLKSASFQFLIHDEDLSIKGQVELADGMRCPVAGTAMEPGILNKDRCKQLVRFIASNEHVYEIPCTPELSSVESDASGKAAAGDAKVEIRTLTCDDHIALTVGGTEVVLRKNGRCRMIRFAEFTQRWRLNKCEVEKLKVPADNEKHGPFSMRYLVNVHGCSLQDPENETNVLDDNVVDNTFVKFLIDPSKLPRNVTVGPEPEHNKVAIIAGSVGGGLFLLAIIASIIGGVCFYKIQKAKEWPEASSIPASLQPGTAHKEETGEAGKKKRVTVLKLSKISCVPRVKPPKDPKDYLEDKELKLRIPVG